MKNWASYVLSCHCVMISVEFLELKVGKKLCYKKKVGKGLQQKRNSHGHGSLSNLFIDEATMIILPT